MWLTSMLEESNGDPSTMRVAVFVIILCVLGNWTYFNVTHNEFVAIGSEGISLILGSLGIKSWQKGQEAGVVNEDKP